MGAMSNPTAPKNLLSGPSIAAPTLLPDSQFVAGLAEAPTSELLEEVAAHPEVSLGWALLAEEALAKETLADNLNAYACARTGYHRGLDALRRSGWGGAGPVPWEHEPNQGFLRALWALAQAAARIGETDEAERCSQFLRDSSETAYQQLTHQH